MLILARKKGQALSIGEIVVKIVDVDAQKAVVKVGIDAPRHIPIARDDAVSVVPKPRRD
jgi:carbon storage regulator CsrA